MAVMMMMLRLWTFGLHTIPARQNWTLELVSVEETRQLFPGHYTDQTVS